MTDVIQSSELDGDPAPEQTASDTPQEQDVRIFDGSGRFLGGRFDTEDGPVTQEMVEQNPVLGKLAQSYAHAERALQQTKNQVSKLGQPLPDDFFESEQYKLDKDGRLDKSTREALRGRPISDAMIDRFEQVQQQFNAQQAEQTQKWIAGWDEATGGKFEEVVDWVRKTQTQAAIDEINASLRSPTTRDIVFKGLVEKFETATGSTLTGTGTNNVPKATFQGGNAPAGGVPGFASLQEYQDMLLQARRTGDKVMENEANRRLAASRHLHANPIEVPPGF